MKTKIIDFHDVEPHQRDIDKRLANWGRWCNPSNGPMTSPMWRMMPPPPRVRGELAYMTAGAVDRMDAMRIHKAVGALPKQHRAALNWCYVKPVSPRKMCQMLGQSMEGLQQLVKDARQMLINGST